MEQAFASWCERAKPLGLDPYVEDYGRAAEDKWLAARSAGVLQRIGLYRESSFPRGTTPAPARLVDIVRECARKAHRDDSGPESAVIQRELAHSTSFFPNVLENIASKALGVSFVEAPSTYSSWSRESDGDRLLQDISRPQFSEAPSLDETPELMPIQEGSFVDKAAKIKIKTYGKRFSVSRAVIVNDDIGVFDSIVAAFGRSARRKIDDLVYAELIANPTLLSDSVAIFNASHGNLVTGAGSALSSSSLSTARKNMRVQKGPNGAIINVTPRYLVVPPSLETKAEELVHSIVRPDATTAANTLNVFSMGGLDVVTEPRLEADSPTRWYLMATKDMSVMDVLFLGGQRRPTILREEHSPILGFAWTCYIDVGVGAVDFRGAVRNDGA
jgi:hypothetical protein